MKGFLSNFICGFCSLFKMEKIYFLHSISKHPWKGYVRSGNLRRKGPLWSWKHAKRKKAIGNVHILFGKATREPFSICQPQMEWKNELNVSVCWFKVPTKTASAAGSTFWSFRRRALPATIQWSFLYCRKHVPTELYTQGGYLRFFLSSYLWCCPGTSNFKINCVPSVVL